MEKQASRVLLQLLVKRFSRERRRIATRLLQNYNEMVIVEVEQFVHVVVKDLKTAAAAEEVGEVARRTADVSELEVDKSHVVDLAVLVWKERGLRK